MAAFADCEGESRTDQRGSLERSAEGRLLGCAVRCRCRAQRTAPPWGPLRPAAPPGRGQGGTSAAPTTLSSLGCGTHHTATFLVAAASSASSPESSTAPCEPTADAPASRNSPTPIPPNRPHARSTGSPSAAIASMAANLLLGRRPSFNSTVALRGIAGSDSSSRSRLHNATSSASSAAVMPGPASASTRAWPRHV